MTMLRSKKTERAKGRDPREGSSSSGKKKAAAREDETSRYRSLADSDEDYEAKSSKRHHHRNRKSKREAEQLKRQLCHNMASITTSSDDDIDPELREGINNIMKLRDEYDKLEGALRKLGVDPESVVGAQGDEHEGEDEAEADEDNLYEEEDDDDFHGRGHVQGHSLQSQMAQQGVVEDLLLDDLDPLSLQNRTARLRRHLDILEEVRTTFFGYSSSLIIN